METDRPGIGMGNQNVEGSNGTQITVAAGAAAARGQVNLRRGRRQHGRMSIERPRTFAPPLLEAAAGALSIYGRAELVHAHPTWACGAVVLAEVCRQAARALSGAPRGPDFWQRLVAAALLGSAAAGLNVLGSSWASEHLTWAFGVNGAAEACRWAARALVAHKEEL